MTSLANIKIWSTVTSAVLDITYNILYGKLLAIQFNPVTAEVDVD